MLGILEFFKDNSNNSTTMDSLLPVSVFLGIVDLLFLTGNIKVENPIDSIGVKTSASLDDFMYFIPLLIMVLFSLATLSNRIIGYGIIEFMECLLFIYSLYNVLYDVGIVYTEAAVRISNVSLLRDLGMRGLAYSLLLVMFFFHFYEHLKVREKKDCNTYNFQFKDSLTEKQIGEIDRIIKETLYDEYLYFSMDNERAKKIRKHIQDHRYVEFYEKGFLIGYTSVQQNFEFDKYVSLISKYLDKQRYKYKITASFEEYELDFISHTEHISYIRVVKES